MLESRHVKEAIMGLAEDLKALPLKNLDPVSTPG